MPSWIGWQARCCRCAHLIVILGYLLGVCAPAEFATALASLADHECCVRAVCEHCGQERARDRAEISARRQHTRPHSLRAVRLAIVTGLVAAVLMVVQSHVAL